MSKMKSIVEAILKMPYYQNYTAASGMVHNIAKHEDAIENVFITHGLSKINNRKVTQKQRDKWMNEGIAADMFNGSFIAQPCGTHQSPDFIVKVDNKIYFIECKSAKGGTPMYNSGVPKAEYIYIFCSKKHDATTVYWGKDVLVEEQERLIYEHIQKARASDAELNSKLACNTHGIQYYTRPMIQHKGKKWTKDYFLNENRNVLENNVLDSV